MNIQKSLLVGMMSASMMMPVYGMADVEGWAKLGDFGFGKTYARAEVQAEMGERGENKDTMRNWREDMRANMRAAICAALNNKEDGRIERFETNRKRHVAVYTNLETKLGRLIARAEAKGYDTVTIEAHAEILGDKIDKFESDWAAYLAAIKAARMEACENAGVDLAAELAEARELLKVAKQSGLEVRTYFKQVIKADIRALHAQAQAEAGEED